jgi:hypothetical protein
MRAGPPFAAFAGVTPLDLRRAVRFFMIRCH